MDMRLELVGVPVSDVDRAIEFYRDKIGFSLDHDIQVNDNLRFVQMTPKGSACSICFGTGVTDNMQPGSVKMLQVVVDDVQALHDELQGRGVEVSDLDPQSWGTFVYFSDPDGNGWALQQMTHRES